LRVWSLYRRGGKGGPRRVKDTASTLQRGPMSSRKKRGENFPTNRRIGRLIFRRKRKRLYVATNRRKKNYRSSLTDKKKIAIMRETTGGEGRPIDVEVGRKM